MQIPAEKIIRLAESDHPSEVRCAAITILGELGGRHPEVSAAILGALASDDGAVRIRAVYAAGQLKIDKALPRLIERINRGGREGELAADAAAKLGAKGSQALREVIHKVVPGVRKYIAAALAGAEADGAKDSSGSGIAMLQEKDPAVIEAAVGTLANRIPDLDAKRKRALADELFEMAKSKKVKLTPLGEAGVVRLASLLDDERVETLLWDRVLPPIPAEVRAAALQALSRFIGSPGKDHRAKLFQCAADTQFRVAAPAMMLLDKLPVTDKHIGEWLALFDAPDLAPRRFALNKVGDRDVAEVSEKLIEQVRHQDRKYRGDVLAKLAGLSKGRKALAEPLRKAETAEEAWDLARVVAPFAKADPKTWGDELFPTLGKHLEANDKRVDPLLFALREAGAAELRDRLESKGASYKKKENFEKALLYYKAAARDPASGFSVRIGLGTVGLLLSKKNLEAEARAHDPSLHAFADLVRQDEPATFKEVESTKWLTADDLYYLGFHFADHVNVMGEFGGKVLKLLLKRFPKNELAASAKNKLKSSGHK
ncbi:MAG: HEAT repeat domain-containing protein [Gemmataceae bacterium]|nr:HEAT repeat domain-containing protein [Gemmataceae bacterium]